MNLHFPDEVATNVLTIDATDPKSGHGRVQGDGDPPGEAVVRWILKTCLDRASRPTPSARRSTRVVGAASAPRTGTGRARRPRRAGISCCPRSVQRSGRVGWVSAGALGYIVAPARRAAGRGVRRRDLLRAVALEERPAGVLHVCDDLSCRLAGARGSPEGAALASSPCLGLCERAPAPRARATIVAAAGAARGADPADVAAAAAADVLRPAGSLRRIARRRVDPESLDAFRATAASTRCAAPSSSGPQAIDARGHGVARSSGAAAPRSRPGRKWEAVAAPAGAAALPRLQRRRVGAGNVQGPRADGAATRSG